MTGEMNSFGYAFDVTYVLKQDLQFIPDKRFPINMFTDSKQVFEAITKGQWTTEKKLIIEVIPTKKASKMFWINAIGLLSGSRNSGDALSKLRHNSAFTLVLAMCTDSTAVFQWVGRSRPHSPKKTTEVRVWNSTPNDTVGIEHF